MSTPNCNPHRPLTAAEHLDRLVLEARIRQKQAQGLTLTNCEEQYTAGVIDCFKRWDAGNTLCANDPNPDECRQKNDESYAACLEAQYLLYLACQGV